MAGRKRLFELYTLDFEEFLTFKDKCELIPEIIRLRSDYNTRSLEEKTLDSMFNEFLIYGGYPTVILENNIKEKKMILQEIVNTYVKRDVMESKVNNEEKFFNLLRILASQAGSLLNMHELANTLRISYTAIENYIYILRKCFHIHLVAPFYANIRKELSKMHKIYFNDQGLRNILVNYFEPVPTRMDKGALIENFTFIRLRNLYGYDKINFWRTSDGKEIDFIVSESFRRGKAYEVKFSEAQYKEEKYQKFISHYPDYELKCIAYKVESNAVPLLRL